MRLFAGSILLLIVENVTQGRGKAISGLQGSDVALDAGDVCMMHGPVAGCLQGCGNI